MRKEISTLTRALTTLTYKMVDKSSKRGGGYESDGGYKTEESEKENTQPRITRSKTKRKFDKVKEKSYADKIKKGDWKYTLNMPLCEPWKKNIKHWWFAARNKEVMRDLKKPTQTN